jgi:hypothetical protein
MSPTGEREGLENSSIMSKIFSTAEALNKSRDISAFSMTANEGKKKSSPTLRKSLQIPKLILTSPEDLSTGSSDT